MARNSKVQERRQEIREFLVKTGFTRSSRATDAYHMVSTGEEAIPVKVDIAGRNVKVFIKREGNWFKTSSKPMTQLDLQPWKDYINRKVSL